MSLSFKLGPPPLAAFIEMRRAEGWGDIREDTALAALVSGLINICAYDDKTLVGFGRVVGDGALYFYIQDVIVVPPYRGKGYGQMIMGRLLTEIKKQAATGATIGLMAAQGKEAFYESFGFISGPNRVYGAGMVQVLS